jgi:5-deoxy-glucuronate isomerase
MSAAALISRHRAGLPYGHTAITREGEATLDTGIDFGIHRMRKGERVEETHPKETAWLLMDGEAELAWDGQRALVGRSSLFDEAPTVLHVAPGATVRIDARRDSVEWAVIRTTNERRFEARLFRPEELAPEYRGAGLAQGASLRNVRLVFDGGNRPEANLVLGEVVNYPGRWSSYPPHHHAQPEIYHYRFTLPQGYGHAELGEEIFKVKSHDTLKILDGVSHAQVSAPGYGMYYIWIVRHLPDNRYTGFTFSEDHRWVLDPEDQGWRPKGGPA